MSNKLDTFRAVEIMFTIAKRNRLYKKLVFYAKKVLWDLLEV